MTRRNDPPATDNPAARILIMTATAKCEGCRIAWRLKGQHHVNGAWTMLCKAQAERAELRGIARDARAAETLS